MSTLPNSPELTFTNLLVPSQILPLNLEPVESGSFLDKLGVKTWPAEAHNTQTVGWDEQLRIERKYKQYWPVGWDEQLRIAQVPAHSTIAHLSAY